MKDELHRKLLATFEIEHRDHVEHIRSLMALVERASAPAGPELDEVFRRAHSLKGAARAVDLKPIEQLAHRLETLFAQVRGGDRTLDADLAGVVQQVLDASEDCMAGLAENRQPRTVAAALEAVGRALGVEEPVAVETVTTDGGAGDSATGETGREPAVPSFERRETVRITARNFEGLFRSATGLAVESQRQHQVTTRLDWLASEIGQLAKRGEQARRLAAAAAQHAQTSNELSHLTDSLHALERSVQWVSRQTRAVYHQHHRNAWRLRQLGRQLQQDVWQARLVPAESLLEGVQKMMRDLARDEGKEIRLLSSSTGVHADRRVLEALKDPILHLLRNAVCHGIEHPSERLRKGKPAAGEVALRIDAQGQRLTVTIEDDGRGIDFARVAEVAGLAPSAPPEELKALLFRPGFSTAPAVTSLAGRGMGLSVVQETVRRLDGDLDLGKSPSGGARIVLSVPLSIATQRLLLVRCSGEIYALPISGIERLYRRKTAEVATVGGRAVLQLNGDRVPLGNLSALLGVAPGAASESGTVLVIRSGARRGALMVDAVVNETEATIQSLGPAAGSRLSAGAVLEDGSVALVVNLADLVEWIHADESRPLSQMKPAAPEPAARVRATIPDASILVVDDSLTTRTLQRSILEAHGYRVRVAVDGADGLRRVREERPGLVIADIEMPHLDGFGLLEAIKTNPELERIPVIIVSSLDQREHRERGLALGADGYIVKQKFDQEELLAVVRQIL